MRAVRWLRRGLLARIIVHGVVLLVVSAFGFLVLAAFLLGDDAKHPGRDIGRWFGTRACEDHARRGALGEYPVVLFLYSRGGQRLGGPSNVEPPPMTARDLAEAEEGHVVAVGRPPISVVPCSDGSGRYALVLPGPRPPGPPPRLSIAVVGMVILVAVGSIPLARSLVKPLRGLVETSIRFGEGNLSARADVRRSDEIGDLALAFNAMAGKLETRIRGEREMLANISHELRTPLARVRVVLETAREDPSRAAPLLVEISRDLSDLERLTDDVLSMIRLDFVDQVRTGLRLRRETIDLAALVRQSIARCAELNPERELELEGAERPLTLAGDPSLLSRVLDNVLDNARKYSAGTISVRVESEEGNAIVVVADRGIGIDAPDLEHVFDPFFRSDRSRQRDTGGNGLGLALCRRIVVLHRGTIAISSALGEGTKVTVSLPM